MITYRTVNEACAEFIETFERHGCRRPFKRLQRSRTYAYFATIGPIALNIDIAPYFRSDDWQDLLLHEVAHWIDWRDNKACGHGVTFKRICQKLGCDPQSCCRYPYLKAAMVRAAPYVVPCITCSEIRGYYYRKPRASNYTCNVCKSPCRLVKIA